MTYGYYQEHKDEILKVTGSDGKTTTTTLISEFLDDIIDSQLYFGISLHIYSWEY